MHLKNQNIWWLLDMNLLLVIHWSHYGSEFTKVSCENWRKSGLERHCWRVTGDFRYSIAFWLKKNLSFLWPTQWEKWHDMLWTSPAFKQKKESKEKWNKQIKLDNINTLVFIVWGIPEFFQSKKMKRVTRNIASSFICLNLEKSIQQNCCKQ